MTLGVDEPSWIEILQAVSDRVRATIHVSLPGTVVDYDPSTCTATVQLGVQEDQGDGTFETIPPLTDVPIAWPSGGGFSLTFPLAAGDPVNVIFAEADPRGFRRSGDVEPPDTLRRFGLYASAQPCGAYVDGRAPRAVAGKTILTDSGGVSICLDGSLINLGADSAADFVALAAAVTTALNDLKSAISGAVVVANDGGASLKTSILAALSAWPPNVAAAKVKAT